MRGLDRVIMTWTNIGNRGASGDADSLESPVQNYSIAGIAFAPNSIWTRVELQFFNALTGFVSQTLTSKAAYIGDIAAPWKLRVEDPEGQYSDAYLPTNSVTPTTFNQGMGNGPDANPVWGGVPLGTFPSAELFLFLRPPQVVIPVDYHLYNRGTGDQPDGGFLVAGGTNVIRVLAVPDRRRLRAVFKCGGTGQFTAQITAAPGGFAAQNGAVNEFPIASGVVVTATQQAEIVVDPLVDVYWIFVKLTLDAGAPTCQYTITAE